MAKISLYSAILALIIIQLYQIVYCKPLQVTPDPAEQPRHLERPPERSRTRSSNPTSTLPPLQLPECEAGPSRVLYDTDDEEELDFEADPDDDLVFGRPLSANEGREVLKRAMEMLDKPAKKTRTGQFDIQAILLCKKLFGQEFEPGWRINSPDDKKTDPDYCPELDLGGKGPKRHISPETMKRIIELHDSGKSEKAIKAQYKWYSRAHLPKLRACLLAGESQTTQSYEINTHALNKVREVRLANGPIRGRMIQRWAVIKAREIGATWFKGSDSWLYDFKKRNRIGSRKATKFRSRSEMNQQEETDASIIAFRETYSQLTKYFPNRAILNTDQTGFNYEASTGRTLSFVGERDTVLRVDDKNKVTHSYTAQPTITRDGRLLSPLFLCMQETSGHFGPRVQKDVDAMMEKRKNIVVVASKSGKLTSELYREWVRKSLLPNTDDMNLYQDELDIGGNETWRVDNAMLECVMKSRRMDRDRSIAELESMCRPRVLLLADSWSGQNNEETSAMLAQARVHFLQIPKLTTDKLQPLDVGYNRQYKKLWKRIEEEAWMEGIIKDLTSRAGIINMQSLIHDQLSSPRYRDMIRAAWHSTDPNFNLDELEFPAPQQVVDINFGFRPSTMCEHAGCNRTAFIRCSHCGRHWCLHHFLGGECMHYPYTDQSLYEADVDRAQPSEPFCRPLNISQPVSSTTESPSSDEFIPAGLAIAVIKK